MAKPVPCPKCHRTGTYSEKWRRCTGCGLGMVARDTSPDATLGPLARALKRQSVPGVSGGELFKTIPSVTDVTETVTGGREGVTKSVTSVDGVTFLVTGVPGEKCPCCGRKLGLSGAQRMAALREKERLKQEARAADGG